MKKTRKKAKRRKETRRAYDGRRQRLRRGAISNGGRCFEKTEKKLGPRRPDQASRLGGSGKKERRKGNQIMG